MAETTELEISRYFEATPDAVWRAFVEPALLAEWFGPEGFYVPLDSVEIDVRVGGAQRFVMLSREDAAMSSPINAIFTEVVDGVRLVGEEDVEGVPGFEGISHFRLRLDFAPDGDGARLDLRQGPFSSERSSDAASGWESSFKKLDVLLATATPEPR
jgi:uncharacterized protein YndB with AHSA1/START domain